MTLLKLRWLSAMFVPATIRRRRTILAFLAFAMFAVPISAQTAAEPSLAELALQARLKTDLRAFCHVKPDFSELCKETPEVMSKKMISSYSPEEIRKLLSMMEQISGDDHSWVGKAGGVSSASGGAKSQAQSDASTVTPSGLNIMDLSCGSLAKAVLQNVDPKLDVEFPGRGEWERDLCRVRTEWHDQYLRYEAHKGTSTEVAEREQAADWWQLLQARAWEGPAKARSFLAKQPAGKR